MLMGAMLHNRGLLETIDPADRPRWGPEWSERSADGLTYRLLGGYECMSSRIHVDPTLRPFNLGASLIHEMDHLFRDKASPAYDPAKRDALFSAPLISFLNANKRWKGMAAADETFASVLASLYQRLLSAIPARFGDPGAYQVPADLLFFRKDGNMEALLSALGLETPEAFLARALAQDFRNPPPGSVWQLVRREWDAIWGQVKGTFFQPPPAAGDPSFEILDAPGFTTSLLWQSTYLRRMPWEFYDERAREWKPFSLDETQASSARTRALLEPQLYIPFAIHAKVAAPSAMCQAYQEAVARGELEGYLGARLRVLPGEGGVKPGGVVKPGEGGVKPGEGGVKPTLRPCLRDAV
jgi:hypothetical protein